MSRLVEAGHRRFASAEGASSLLVLIWANLTLSVNTFVRSMTETCRNVGGAKTLRQERSTVRVKRLVFELRKPVTSHKRVRPHAEGHSDAHAASARYNLAAVVAPQL